MESIYENFYLLLKPVASAGKGYCLEVRVAADCCSEIAAATAEISSLDLDSLLQLQTKLVVSNVRVFKEVGNFLADWLFVDRIANGSPGSVVPGSEILNPVGNFLQEQRTHRILRLFLSLDPALLNSPEFRGTVPFECLEYNDILPHRFVRLAIGNSEIGSAVSTPLSSTPVTVSGKLKALLVQANPKSYTPRDSLFPHLEFLEQHVTVLRQALEPLVHGREIFIREITNPTPEQFLASLGEFNPHVLIFAGHGYSSKHGGIVCVRHGAPAPLSFPEIARTIRQIPALALRLTVLIACNSFAAAPSLIHAGLNAVVAMQPFFRTNYPEAGIAPFAKAFFSAISHFSSIQNAYDAARRALAISAVPYASLMPTLWLASPHDQLFSDPRERFQAQYLDALLSKPELSSFSYPGRGSGIEFRKLYVNQTVSEEQRRPSTEVKRSVVSRNNSPSVQIKIEPAMVKEVIDSLPVDLWNEIETHRQILIEAPAWTGKSTLCKWVVHECFLTHKRLPIFIRFRDFAQSGKSLESFLEQDYTDYLGLKNLFLPSELPTGKKAKVCLGRWLRDELDAGRALLVLDGLDEEFRQDIRKKALSFLPSAREQAIRPYVLLTSRPMAGDSALGFRLLKLQAFQHDQIRHLVRSCGQALGCNRRAEDFILELERPGNRQMLDLAARPGHLIHMFALYSQDGILPQAEDDLMDQIAAERFEIKGRTETKCNPDEPFHKRLVVERLAFNFLFHHTGQIQSREETLVLIEGALEEIRTAGGKRIYSAGDAGLMLEDICRNSGFLQEIRKRFYGFESVPWQHFFAASHIRRGLEEGDLRVSQWVRNPRWTAKSLASKRPALASISFAHCLWNPDLHPVILYLAGMLKDASVLIERIEKEPNDILNQMIYLRVQALTRGQIMNDSTWERTCEEAVSSWRQEPHQKFPFEEMSLTSLRQIHSYTQVEALMKPLIEALQDDHARSVAAEMLGKIGHPNAIPALREKLEDDSGISIPIAEALMRMGDLDSIPILSRWANKEDPEVSGIRAFTASILSEMGSPDNCGALAHALTHQDEVIRRASARALALSKTKTKEIVPALSEALENEDPIVRRDAAVALGSMRDGELVSALVRALADEDVTVREAAADALGNTEDTRAIPALIQAVADKDKSVVWWAVFALGKIGHPDAVPTLVQALKDSNDSVRVCATLALSKIRNPGTVSILAQAFSNNNATVRRSVTQALGESRDPSVIPVLVQALDDCNATVRQAAAKALGKTGHSSAVPYLVQALENADSAIREIAVEALTKIKNHRIVPILVRALTNENANVRMIATQGLRGIRDPWVVEALVKTLADNNATVRRTAAETLGSTWDSSAIPALVQTLGDGDSKVRRAAAEALGKTGDSSAIPSLVQALENADSAIRKIAAEALTKIKNHRIVPILVRALTNENANVRMIATQGLREIRDPWVVEALVKTLADKDPTVRQSAAWALGKTQDSRAVIALAQALKDENDSVRMDAALALGETENREAILALVQAIRSDDVTTRWSVALALAGINDREAVPALVQALKDDRDMIRTVAAEALGSVGDSRAVPALIQALKDDNSTVQWLSTRALLNICLVGGLRILSNGKVEPIPQ